MLNRLLVALPRLDRFTFSPAHAAAAQGALQRLQQQREAAQLDEAALGELECLLRKHTELSNGLAEPTTDKPPAKGIKSAPLAEVNPQVLAYQRLTVRKWEAYLAEQKLTQIKKKQAPSVENADA